MAGMGRNWTFQYSVFDAIRSQWAELGRSLAPLRRTWLRLTVLRKGSCMTEAADHANVRFPPPLIYLIALLLGIFAGRALSLPLFGMASNARILIASAFALSGAIVILSGARLFLRHGTAVIPHRPATRLVTTGVYRLTRNPMYLGMALLYVAFAIVFDSLLALVLLPVVLVVIQTHVIAKEEAYLQRKFDDEYLAYKTRVRRWI